MSDKELMFDEVKKLTLACGEAIDKIAKDTNINQNLIARLFLETMQSILDKMKEI